MFATESVCQCLLTQCKGGICSVYIGSQQMVLSSFLVFSYLLTWRLFMHATRSMWVWWSLSHSFLKWLHGYCWVFPPDDKTRQSTQPASSLGWIQHPCSVRFTSDQDNCYVLGKTSFSHKFLPCCFVNRSYSGLTVWLISVLSHPFKVVHWALPLLASLSACWIHAE